MFLTQLQLTNFRSYHRLGLDLAPGVGLFRGQNGEGKTNLLEAVYVLATTKSPRTSAERELVSWHTGAADGTQDALAGLPPFARVEGRVRRREGEVHLEILFKGEAASASPPDGAPAAASEAPPGALGEVAGRLGRSIKVNGLPTRAADLIGQLAVVYFAPEDVSLAGGAPAGRRRYLDLANAQVAPLYLRALQQYNRILLQRNHVLRRIRERRQPRAVLEPWTEQMVRTGAFLLGHRLRMVAAVNQRAAGIFHDLAGTDRRFRVDYRSTACDVAPDAHGLETRAIAGQYRARQAAALEREIEQAVSLVGPHRDDFVFLLDDVDLNTYGSRGQQRLAVLALKLAEAEWMCAETGEVPVLLLDDVLSELDPRRRQYVLGRVAPAEGDADLLARRQVLITTTDTHGFPAPFLAAAHRFDIDAGVVRRA